MLGSLRTSALCRLAAAALALALSGAPRAAAALAPEKPHRCQCRHGAHERCTCPVCGKRALQARRNAVAAAAADADATPCERAAAQRALADEEDRARRDRDVPCVQGDCGGDLPAAPPRASVEPFTLPDPPAVGRAAPSGAIPAPASGDGAGAPAPEPPPPRAA
jgi:hypothetical protein